MTREAIIQDMGKRLDNGRDYLMQVLPSKLNIEDIFEAFGFDRNGFENQFYIVDSPEPFRPDKIAERYTGIDVFKSSAPYDFIFRDRDKGIINDIRISNKYNEMQCGAYCISIPETWEQFESDCERIGIKLERRAE